MSELPEIHEAERLHLKPGDILVLRNNEIDRDQADDLVTAVRRKLGLGSDFRFLVIGRDWSCEAVGLSDVS